MTGPLASRAPPLLAALLLAIAPAARAQGTAGGTPGGTAWRPPAGTASAAPAGTDGLDMSHGGPVEVTAVGGIDWDQKAQTVTAHGDARAVRDNVTVLADRLIAYYRKKPAAPGTTQGTVQGTTQAAAQGGAPAGGTAKPAAQDAGSLLGGDAGGSEIYRLVAQGHVRIYTPTDYAQGDTAVYDMDQAVLVLTGGNLKLITPQDTLTARDSLEYWSQKRMSVGRGDATVVTSDGRRLSADVLVGYTTPAPANGAPAATPAKATASADPLAASGKLQKVDAFGNVVITTPTETVHGDRGVYVPDIGIARLQGNVHITRGPNELTGNEAEVNLKTGVARLISSPGGRVEGLVVPEQGNAPADAGDSIMKGGAPAPAKGRAAPERGRR